MNDWTSKSIDWLDQWAMRNPAATALICGESGTVSTYSELSNTADRMAGVLTSYGVKLGDRVAVQSMNGMWFVPLLYACYRIGATLVPVNFRLSSVERNQILADVEPTLVISEQSLAGCLSQGIELEREQFLEEAKIFSIIPDRLATFPENQPLIILYTSGTTGLPKGVLITPRMIYWNGLSTIERLQLSDSDGTVAFFFHTGGWNVLLLPLLSLGAKVVMLNSFKPDLVLKLTSQYDCTIIFGVPTTLTMLASSAEFATSDLNSVRFAIVGGEPMPLSLIETWHKKGVAIRQGYGLSEFGPNVFSLGSEWVTKKPGSIGTPNSRIEARLVADSGATIEGEGTGELWLQGPAASPGYWRQPELTKATMGSGWVRTGDILRRDPEGFYYVVGRKKEMFISGGENVYPAEVERALSGHAGVKEVAVIGVPDQQWGEVGKAFIVLESGCNQNDVKDYSATVLAKYKVPKHFEFVTSLPKAEKGQDGQKSTEWLTRIIHPSR